MFSDPEQNVPFFALTEGMKVADFGAGSGAYALAMAKRVGHTGKVYAIDVQNELLSRLDKVAREQGRRNIQIVWGNVEKPGGSKLAPQSVDAVVLANVLFQSDAKYTMALEAKRILRPAGRAIVIDWHPPAGGSFGGLGPTPDRVVSVDEVKKIFEQAGFKFEQTFAAGDHHYGAVFSLIK